MTEPSAGIRLRQLPHFVSCVELKNGTRLLAVYISSAILIFFRSPFLCEMLFLRECKVNCYTTD